MAKNSPNNKGRLKEHLVLAFVIITMSLLVIQLGMNTLDTIEQASEDAPVLPTATVVGPPPPPTSDVPDVDSYDG